MGPSRRRPPHLTAPVLAALALSAATLACGGSGSDAVPPLTLLVSGGTVIDGTGAAGVTADVGIAGDRVVWMGAPGTATAPDTLDAGGLVVAPGFLDVHSHTSPRIASPDGRLNEGVVRQGVTTVVGGPDGYFSPAMIRDLVAAHDSLGIGTNVAYYVGHNGIRADVMGDDPQRAPTDDELEAMRAQVREGMELGAVGFSTGLMYEPGMFGATDEVVAMAAEVAPYGGIYDSHVRNPVHALLDSDREVVRIAEEAGIGGKIGHLKAVGLHNAGVIGQIVALVEESRGRGLEIVSDQYPYDGAATAPIEGILVPPADAPGLDTFTRLLTAQRAPTAADLAAAREELRAAFADPAAWAALKESSENGVDGGFAWLKATGYTSMRVVSAPSRPELVGRYLSELAEESGRDPFRVVTDLVASGEAVNITLGAIDEADVRELMIQPWNMIASDGAWADGSDSPDGHPRSAGTFPRFLGHYVRDQGVLPLEEAVRKITSLPADFLGLGSRGRLAPGLAADLAIFDAATIIDRSDWDHPNRFADGVIHVVVNGVPVLRDGAMTGEAPGRVVRPERSATDPASSSP